MGKSLKPYLYNGMYQGTFFSFCGSWKYSFAVYMEEQSSWKTT